jgi:hypothetical protein
LGQRLGHASGVNARRRGPISLPLSRPYICAIDLDPEPGKPA